MVSLEGDKIVLTREVVSLEGDNLVVFYYLSSFEIGLIRAEVFGESGLIRGEVFGGEWPDKRGGFW